MSRKRMLIIGGGASGTAVLAQLVEQLVIKKVRLEILLFEKGEKIGPGLAYGTTLDANLLNTPAGTMGIYVSNPRHFLDWLAQNPSKWQSEFPNLTIDQYSTPPRRLYGIYLGHMANSIAHKAEEHGIHLTYSHEEVVDVDVEKMIFYLANGQNIQGDIAVLALGAFPSLPFPHLQEIKGYFSSPFPEDNLIQNISSEENCIIVGSRLSGIDTILTLKSSGYKGKLFCISKSGTLPHVQGIWSDYDRKFLTHKKLNQLTLNGNKNLAVNKLFYLIRREIEEAEKIRFRWKDFDAKNQSTEIFLLQEINAASKIRNWQSALYNTNDLLNPIWEMLSDKDKHIVIQKYLGIFLASRAAFPIQNAKKLYKLIKKNELEVLGNIRSVKYDSSEKVFLAIFDNQVIKAPYLINATGVCTDIELVDSILINNLRKRKVIRPHRFGGIKVNPKTLNIIGEFGHQYSNFFVIGGLLRGTHAITNLLEYIVKTSKKITENILNQFG